MAKARRGAGLIVGGLLCWGAAAPAWAAPTVAQILNFRPKQPGIAITTPAASEHESCKVELVKGTGRGSGWLLKDAHGRPVRRFFDTDGNNKIDVYSYYHYGVEVYREIDSNGNDKVDQYRWLNSAGMKWGIDVNEDGKIDTWKMISPEEVSQEVLQAVATRDVGRLQALWITVGELKALDLPAAELGRIRDLQKQAAAKFQNTVAKLTGIGEGARWLTLETTPPACVPSDATGMKGDLVKHRHGTILYESAGKHDWMQTGEMIQVGPAWRIIDAPTPGQDAGHMAGDPGAGVAAAMGMDAEIQPLLEELRQLDEKAPQAVDTPGPNAETVRYNLKRADLLERIVAQVKPDSRDQWLRQVSDCLCTAAQNSPAGDKTAYQRLSRLVEQITRSQPGSGLAAYVAYREMNADYASQLTGPRVDYGKVQEKWLARLAKFVQTYPRADDTADALLQLGMVNEFAGKETEAKNWYENLVTNFPDHGLAAKARGALNRMGLEGKPMELTGKVLGTGAPFDIAGLKGKVVVIYYWASWNTQCAADFAKLKQLLETYGGKGLEVVCISLDQSEAEAKGFLSRGAAPGTHLFQEGGLESPLAREYGVMVLPNLFLVGKEGKVLSRTVQMTNLEDEIKKQIK